MDWNYEYDRAGIFVCTKERPWFAEMKGYVRNIHPDAEELRQRDGYSGGDMIDYRCPHCGKEFSEELPQ